eukprot:3912491-Pyramimonas_sp.AAC.2
MAASCSQLAGITVCDRSHVTIPQVSLRRSSQLAFTPKGAARAQFSKGTCDPIGVNVTGGISTPAKST